MALPARDWSVEDLASLPADGNRYEIIDGELHVSPSPAYRHQRIVGRLYVRLAAYLAAHPVGGVLMAPADVVFTRRDVVVPDLLVLPLVDGREPESWEEAGRLLLAIEVLSPSTMSYDRYVKRPLYQRQGVPEFWIVDGEARLVERWRPDDTVPETLVERIEWAADPARPPLVIELGELFAEALGR